MSGKTKRILFIIAAVVLCCFRMMEIANEPKIVEVDKNVLIQEEQEEKAEENIEVEPKEVVDTIEKTQSWENVYLEFAFVNKLAGIYNDPSLEDAPTEFIAAQEAISIIAIEENAYKVLDNRQQVFYLKKEDVSLKSIVMYAIEDAPVYDIDGEFVNIVIKASSDVEVVGKIKDAYKIKINDTFGYVDKVKFNAKNVNVKKDR